MKWVQRKHNIEQVGRYLPRANDEGKRPDPLVKRAGIMQSLPSYRVSRCMFDDEFIFCLVTQGRGWLITAGKRIDLSTGDMFCIFPAVTTEYGTHSRHLMHKSWVGFTGAQVPGLVDQLGFSPDHPAISLGTTMQTIVPLVSEMRHELLAHKVGYSWRAAGLLWQTFGELQRILQRPAEDNPPSAELIRQAARYIDLHFADINKVSDIATYAGLSRSHFSTLFGQAMGLSPLDYLTEVRLAHAERLLTQTTLSVQIIALSVGIQDRAYFSRLFKLRRGISPRGYRLAHQASE